MIKILNTSFNRLGVIKNAINSNRLEEINGENILDFEAVLDQKLNNFIDENSIFELDNDWFDTAYLKKTMNEDNTFTVEVESEHVSYRLNREEYNVEFFTEIGTPTYILGKILNGTGFTVGTVDFSGTKTYSAQEAKSRRQLLMEFVAYLKGEVIFNKFAVSIVEHRGSTETKPVIKDRNVKVISTMVNKRQVDDNGDPVVSYTCTPIYLPGDSYSLGDDIILRQRDLGLDEELRVVSISRDVYDSMNVTFQFANYINGLEDRVYRIETSTLIKGKTYYGARISPENGFESIRSDKMARGVFNADLFALQTGDGSGDVWENKLYFDPVLGKYIFTGTLQAADGIFKGSITIGDDENNIIIDQYGMDTKFIKWFKNMCYNSSFEVRNSDNTPTFWNGGVCSADSNFFGTWSLKLVRSDICSQTEAAGVNPQWYNDVSESTRVSFHKKGGKIKIYVLDCSNGYAQFTLTDEEGNTGSGIEYDYNSNWEPAAYTITFVHGESTKFIVLFENTDEASDAYIDGVIIEPDYTGKRPSFYTDGPNSTASSNGIALESSVIQSIYVQDDEPDPVVVKDVWIKTNDHSKFDKLALITNTTLSVSDDEFITADGTFTIILHEGTASGVTKWIYNIGDGIITIEGVINGETNMYLYPKESVKLMTDGTNWRY